jgi:hypothetical protein
MEDGNAKTVDYLRPLYSRMTHFLQINKLGNILLQVVGQRRVEYWARKNKKAGNTLYIAMQLYSYKYFSDTFSVTLTIGKPHGS